MENIDSETISFIAADWGTTNLRIWAIDVNGDVICKRTSDQGMSMVEPDGFESILVKLTEDLLSNNWVMPVVICGMVGSKNGWMEAPYESVPSNVSKPKRIVSPKTKDPRISVKILPGLKQRFPEDVMRGEETQISGFLRNNPNFSGCLCLPGTHTKWVAVEKGLVERFQTSITGEMYNILSRYSILQLTLDMKSWDQQEFLDSVQEITKSPDLLLSMLFRIRAKSLLIATVASPTTAVLSGLLIGYDVLSAKYFWQNRPIYVLGEEKLANLYADAFSFQKIDATVFNVDQATVLGLISAKKIAFELNTYS